MSFGIFNEIWNGIYPRVILQLQNLESLLQNLSLDEWTSNERIFLQKLKKHNGIVKMGK